MSLLTQIAGRIPQHWISSVSRLQYQVPQLKRAVELAGDLVRNRDMMMFQGAGRGLRFNPGGANAGYALGTSEPEMQNALRAMVRPGATVYDVGANVGFLAMIAARLTGPAGRVVCFEPLPRNVHWIEHNARLNHFDHVSVRELALGNEEGTVSFAVSAYPTMGRLSKLGAPNAAETEVTVPIRRLDDVIRAESLPSPDLLKLDIEGAEIDALAGAEKTLSESRPMLLIELHGTNEGVAAALEKHGYEARVLGSRQGVRECRWNSHVAAVPREKTELHGVIDALTSEKTLRL